FSMPFYFLLIANGCLSIAYYVLRIAYYASHTNQANTQYVIRNSQYVLTSLVLLCFAAGAYNYFSPEAHLPLTYRPDFRGAAHYLSGRVSPQDTIVFVDDPGLGYTISNYYWKGH